MTLLAFHLEPDFVEIVTDSLGTNDDRSSIVTCSKCWYLPHLDAAISANGVADLPRHALSFIELGCSALDFDGLVDQLVAVLPDVWSMTERRYARHDAVPDASSLFVFGFSTSRGRYVGYELAGGGETPAAWAWKPIDVRRAHPEWTSDDEVSGVFSVRPFDDPFRLLDTNEAPASDGAWALLAAERQRTASVLIGGYVVLTRLERGPLDVGMATQRRIHYLEPTDGHIAPRVDSAPPTRLCR